MKGRGLGLGVFMSLVAGAASLLAVATNIRDAASAELGDVARPIKLAINEWTGQHLTTHIAGRILEKMGYKVEYVTAGYIAQHIAIADGSLDASLEVWSSQVSDVYHHGIQSGKIVDLGSVGLETREGWLYPKYVEAMCPGLPDWTALKSCAAKFATPETFPNGRIVAYPAEWGTRTADRIAGLALPYKAVPAGSEGALIAELKGAAAAQKPLIMEFWSPHWVLAEVEVEWVNLPPRTAECEETHACEFPQPIVTKEVRAGFDTTWPAAFELLKQYKLDAGEQMRMVLEIDQKGRSLETVVSDWLEKHEATWKGWIEAARR